MALSTFDDMTKCLKQYLVDVGIDEKYIHIKGDMSKQQWNAGSLSMPIFGINSDPHAHTLLYGRKTQPPYKKFIALRDSENIKFNVIEIQKTEDMLKFLRDALTPAINLNDKVDIIIQKLDNLLHLSRKPIPAAKIAPQAAPKPWYNPWGK
jgi:hypothetical protein